MSSSRDLKLSMLLRRHSRFSQPLRSNKVSAVKHSIDEGGSSLIAVYIRDQGNKKTQGKKRQSRPVQMYMVELPVVLVFVLYIA